MDALCDCIFVPSQVSRPRLADSSPSWPGSHYCCPGCWVSTGLAPRRIRVNAVSPGTIQTPIWSKSAASPETLAKTMEQVSAQIPFGRLGTAREVAEVVAFLASDGASYVTGQNIVVGGGI